MAPKRKSSAKAEPPATAAATAAAAADEPNKRVHVTAAAVKAEAGSDSKSSTAGTSASGEDAVSDILRSTAYVMSRAKHVTIDHTALVHELTSHADRYTTAHPNLPPSWGAQWYHYAEPTAQPERTAQYVLVLDALNFCFWPAAGYEYEHLAGGLKRALLADPTSFSAESLATISESTLSGWLQPPAPLQPNNPPAKATAAAAAAAAAASGGDAKSVGVVIPLLSERVRAVREVGRGLLTHFGGQALNLVKAAKGSAVRLVELVTAHFPLFRDHTVSGGRQILLYKRAQIFVGDIWGAFNGANAMIAGGANAKATAAAAAAASTTAAATPAANCVGYFHDIDRLTCFADYRVPQLLRAISILRYSKELSGLIDSLTELAPGSEMETELRAATIQAVDAMQVWLKAADKPILSIQLDWILWERGEAQLATLAPHHRTLTVYY